MDRLPGSFQAHEDIWKINERSEETCSNSRVLVQKIVEYGVFDMYGLSGTVKTALFVAYMGKLWN